MNFKFFSEKPFNQVPENFAPKPGDLFVSPDPDNKLPIDRTWLVAYQRLQNRNVYTLQLGVFWDQRSAKIFAKALNRGQIEKIAQAAEKPRKVNK